MWARNISIFLTVSSVAHLCCLLGKWLTQLHNHILVCLLICSHVNAGNPLWTVRRVKWKVVSLAPLSIGPVLAFRAEAHPSFRFEVLDTLGAQRTSSTVYDHPAGRHVYELISSEQWLNCSRASALLYRGRDRDERGGVSVGVQQVGGTNAAFKHTRKYNDHNLNNFTHIIIIIIIIISISCGFHLTRHFCFFK